MRGIASCFRGAAYSTAAFSPLGYHRLSGRAHPRRLWDGHAWGDILFAASYWESRPSPAQRRLFSASARPQARACLQRSRDILKVAPQWAASFILLSVPCHPIACTVAGRLCGSAALAAPANRLFKDQAGPDYFDKAREPVTSQGHCLLECRIHYRERAWSASRLES